jgi:hypothetical protein
VDRQQVNPWTWQDAAGFSQAWRVEEARATALGVTVLARPGMMVEVEAIAAGLKPAASGPFISSKPYVRPGSARASQAPSG